MHGNQLTELASRPTLAPDLQEPMTPPPKRPAASLMRQLRSLSSRLNSLAVENVLDEYSFEMRDWIVISAVADLGLATQRAIADRAELDKVAVNRASTRLKARGFLRVHPNHDDGRSHLLELSDNAQKLVERCSAELAVLERMALECFTDHEQDQLARLQRRLSSSLDELEADLGRREIL